MFVTKITQSLKKSRGRRYNPLEWLDNDSGDILMFRQQSRDRVQIIEGRNQHLICDRARNACAVRHRLREIHALCRRKAHLGLRAHAVIAALEFQDFLMARIGARQTNSVHVCLATGGDKADLFATGHSRDNGLSQFDPFGVVCKKGHPLG